MLRSFIDGFLAVKDELIDAVSGVLDEVNEFLPFSDARRGPLANLTASGRAIIETLAAGIRQVGGQPVNQALQGRTGGCVNAVGADVAIVDRARAAALGDTCTAIAVGADVALAIVAQLGRFIRDAWRVP